MKAYQQSSTSVAKSQEGIRRILAKYGAKCDDQGCKHNSTKAEGPGDYAFNKISKAKQEGI